MKVIKRNGSEQQFSLDKIQKRISELSKDKNINELEIIKDVTSGLYDGIKTTEIDRSIIIALAARAYLDTDYDKAAAKAMSGLISKEVSLSGVNSFYDSAKKGHELGIFSDNYMAFVEKYKDKLNAAIKHNRDNLLDFSAMAMLHKKYLTKNLDTEMVIERPQYLFMRVAAAIFMNVDNPDKAIEYYNVISNLLAMPSTPTLFNAGTKRQQMSSCYLLDSPEDSLDSIFKLYSDVAQISKWAGGIGLSMTKLRSRGSKINGTNGKSNGLISWMKILDSIMGSVNQGGKRKGSACVYIEPWHADIVEFLEARNNTGHHELRTHNLNLANWIPDLFMKRVLNDEDWTLFSPSDAPRLSELYGESFDNEYLRLESLGIGKKIKARELYGLMMKTLAETGNGWMCFKDHSNKKSNQVFDDRIIHSSNLCTEILETTSQNETAVCNLASINLAKMVKNGGIDENLLANTVDIVVEALDLVIDNNFYPIESSKNSNLKMRPVGLGVMGFQDMLFQLDIPFESSRALELSEKTQELIYYHALKKSMQLAIEKGPHAMFEKTKAANGILQFDMWDNVRLSPELKWDELKQEIMRNGLRNSLLIAIAPTSSISVLCGAYECIEPQVSNLFKRESLSGEFIVLNKYLVQKLKKRGAWNEKVAKSLVAAQGKVSSLDILKEDEKSIFKTAWEIPAKTLLNLARARAPFIDQSQSLNLFVESPNIGKLSSMYMYAFQLGLKTTYYLRSRPASEIKKTMDVSAENKENPPVDSAVACSLENPDACESCQ